MFFFVPCFLAESWFGNNALTRHLPVVLSVKEDWSLTSAASSRLAMSSSIPRLQISAAHFILNLKEQTVL